MSSLKPEDCRPYWQDLEDSQKTVLDEWFTFFSKRYNVVGRVVDDEEAEDGGSVEGELDSPAP